MDKLHEMKLHEEIDIDRYNEVMRVPGGWIYKTTTECTKDGWMVSTVFVPHNDEFM